MTDGTSRFREVRWVPLLAVAVTLGLHFLMDDRFSPGSRWVVAGFESALILVLLVRVPERRDRRARVLRRLSIGLVGALIGIALWATVVLVYELIVGGAVTNSANQLLSVGALVWVGNNLAFSLLYWELDGGGPAERSHGSASHPDLAFPQHTSAELAPPGWRPLYVDYLYLGFTNALAFSPTDVMPMVPWAKMAMLLQSLISFVVVGLVIARAVNIFN